MTTELELPNVGPAEIIPAAELEKINATDVALKKLRTRAVELSRNGVPADRTAYTEIHDLTMVAVRVRTGAMKIAKAIAAPLKSQVDAILAEGKRIGDHAAETEELIRPLKEGYETEQERIKAEAERAESERIAARFKSLFGLGMVSDGAGFTVFGMGIDSIEITALPDNEFAELLDSAATAYNAEQTRLAGIEAERVAEVALVAAEQELVRQQQEEERVRLQAIADENRRVAHELQVQQDEFARVQREAADEKRKATLTARVLRLVAMGFTERDNSLTLPLTPAHTYFKDRMANWTNDEFEQVIAEIFEQRLNQEAKAVQDAIDEAARLKAEKQAETDKKKADKERQAQLKPDKKRMREFVKSLTLLPVPDAFTTVDAADLQMAFETKLNRLIKEFTDQIDAL